MINLKKYREFFETLVPVTPGLETVKLVNVSDNMTDTLKGIRKNELPVLFVVVPAARDATDSEPDRVEEVNDCLMFLMDRSDPQRRPALQVLEELQPVVERLKEKLRSCAAAPCHWLYGLHSLSTVPETGLYTDYAGWSVSFKVESE